MSMLEYRVSAGGGLRLTSDFDDHRGQSTPKLSGYAAVFNEPSENLGSFVEKIAPGAFSNTLRRGADVRLLLNHEGLPLARTTARNLRLREDTTGLLFEADIDPTDPDFDRILPKIRSGTLTQMSFGFYVVSDSWEHTKPLPIRTLLECDLFDVSIVTFPAYPQTTVGIRTATEVYSDYLASGRAQGRATEPTAAEKHRQAAAAYRQRLLELQKQRQNW